MSRLVEDLRCKVSVILAAMSTSLYAKCASCVSGVRITNSSCDVAFTLFSSRMSESRDVVVADNGLCEEPLTIMFFCPDSFRSLFLQHLLLLPLRDDWEAYLAANGRVQPQEAAGIDPRYPQVGGIRAGSYQPGKGGANNEACRKGRDEGESQLQVSRRCRAGPPRKLKSCIFVDGYQLRNHRSGRPTMRESASECRIRLKS